MPPSRQGSRQGERPPPSRGLEFPPPSRNGEKPPSRNGEKPPSRSGEKPPSRQGESRLGERPLLSRQGLPMQHIAPESDNDLTVSNIIFLLRFYQKTINVSYNVHERCTPYQKGTFVGFATFRGVADLLVATFFGITPGGLLPSRVISFGNLVYPG